MDTPRLSGKAGEDSCGSTKVELKVDLSGRILTSGTGLPLKCLGDSIQRLYAISECGGLLRTNRAVTTYGLSHRLWDIRQTNVTLSLVLVVVISIINHHILGINWSS